MKTIRRPQRPKPFGLKVYVEQEGSVEKAIRKLKKKVTKCGVLQECRDRQHYTKPSEVRRVAHKNAVKRWKKKQGIK